jgi:hypothetical protein
VAYHCAFRVQTTHSSEKPGPRGWQDAVLTEFIMDNALQLGQAGFVLQSEHLQPMLPQSNQKLMRQSSRVANQNTNRGKSETAPVLDEGSLHAEAGAQEANAAAFALSLLSALQTDGKTRLAPYKTAAYVDGVNCRKHMSTMIPE